MKKENQYEAIIISDIHLGSNLCQADLLHNFIKEISTKKLIINGDLFDNLDFKKLCKKQWRILSDLRKLSKNTEIIWIFGNHCEKAELISHFIGASWHENYLLESGNKKIFIFHGHVFDDILIKYPIIGKIADFGYRILQKIDPSFRLARLAKRNSKMFLRNSSKIKKKSLEIAKKQGYDIVVTGHTHFALSEENYFNCGCWTELPCHYVSVKNGEVVLRKYEKEKEKE